MIDYRTLENMLISEILHWYDRAIDQYENERQRRIEEKLKRGKKS